MKLRISDSLLLPADAVTQTGVVYGMKGQGKTVLAAVLCEELARCGHKFAYLDPIGPGYGMRFAKDGKGKGLDLLILGGRHGDIPIEPTGGAVVADLVVNHQVNTVIDISRRADGKMWTNGEKIRFTAEYCTRLYERQGENCFPMCQLIDEAGRFVPQDIPHGAVDIAKCVGAIEQLTELGRNVGVGIWLITQRSARMKKSVSELAEVMIAFRTIGPNSVGAIVDWLGEHIPKERHKEMIGQLRTLARGHALVVSPGWLEFEGVVQMRMRETFDSSATPTADRKLVTTKPLNERELAKYRDLMAETIERSKAEDPRELKRRIADLEKQVAAKPVAAPAPAKVETKIKEVSVLKQAHVDGLIKAADKLSGRLQELIKRIILVEIEGAPKPQLPKRAELRPMVPQLSKLPVRVTTVKPAGAHDGISTNGKLPKAERKILGALLHFPDGKAKKQVARIAGYAHKGGGFGNALGALRTKGFVRGDDLLVATPAGAAAHGPIEPLPTGRELFDYWINHDDMGQAEREILRVLYEQRDYQLTKEQVAAKTVSASGTPYEPTGGGFGNALGKLRTYELVEGKDVLHLAEEFYL